MRPFILALALVLWLMACESSGGGGGPDIQSLDAPGIDLVVPDAPDAEGDVGKDGQAVDAVADSPGTDTPEPGDATPDLAGPDAPDASPGDTAEADAPPVLPYSQGFIQGLCERYCELQGTCQAPAADCVDACVAAVVAEPGYAKNLACFTSAENCDLAGKCLDEPIPDAPDCIMGCDKADQCGFYPSDMLGADASECGVQCSGFSWLLAGTGMEPVLDCIFGKIDQCDQLGIAECIPEQSNGPCTELCAGLAACQNIPGLFETADACAAACGAWGTGPALAAMACASVGNDQGDTPTPESCAAQAQCFPPPTELVSGTEPFCTALLALCSGNPDFKIPNDLDVCGWLITGFVVRFPGADLVGGTTCVQGKPDCSAPNQVMGCLLPAFEPCAGFCQSVDACLPEPKPADWPGVAGCAQWCSMNHAQEPAGTEQVIQCVALSGDCGTTLDCVPHGQ